MAFWGEILKPGQKKPAKLAPTDVLHLSQACLHEPTKPGKSYLQVEVKGTTYSIACLEKEKREHDCLDLFFDSNDTVFVNKGTCEIHLMGYLEPADLGEESEEEDQPAPKALAPASTKPASPRAAPALSPKVSPKAAPKAAPPAQADEDDDDDELEDEEEEEEAPITAQQPVKASSPKVSPKASPKAAAAAAAEDDDDEDSLLPEEGEESEEEGQVQQMLPAQKAKLASLAAGSPKRKAEAEPQASPAKKGKSEEAASGAAVKDGYVQKLIAYLKANGKTSVGNLGSKVPRPQGVAKMKAILDENKDKFVVMGDMITAK